MKNISTLLVFLGVGSSNSLETKSMTGALSDSYLNEHLDSIVLEKGVEVRNNPL